MSTLLTTRQETLGSLLQSHSRSEPFFRGIVLWILIGLSKKLRLILTSLSLFFRPYHAPTTAAH